MSERPVRYEEGLSATQHGARIGKSRSAVLGHEHRERVKALPPTERPRETVKYELDWERRLVEKHVSKPAPSQERSTNLSKAGLIEATDALTRALTGVLGIKPSGSLERVAERTVTAYLQGYARVATGNRMKQSTLDLMALDVGETCIIETRYRQLVYGQTKTARRKLENSDLRYHVEQIRPDAWEVRRIPDGTWDRARDPAKSVKGSWLAALPLDGPGRIHPTAKAACDIITSNNKSKARLILGVPEADWKSKTTEEGVTVKRIR